MNPRVIQCMLTAAVIAACVTRTAAQVTAGFGADTVQGCAPMVVQFSDESGGNVVSWRWDLGNGTVSFNRNAATTYFNPGQYTVKLVVRDATGNTDSVTKTQYITAYASPTANFSSSATTGCFPLNVQFTDISVPGSGTVSTRQWDFGDGFTSGEPNPLHTYTAPGTYNVSLRVTNSNGCSNTISRQRYIQLENGVKADFDVLATSTCRPPMAVNFTNRSTGTGAISYQWSFGDGSTSAAAAPSHSYLNTGSFTVKLLATNSAGCRDSIIKPKAVIVGTVKADFIPPAVACSGSDMLFTNTSEPTPSGAQWNFGDGTMIDATNAVKKYTTPGTYTIMLLSYFGTCRDSTIKIINVLPPPVAAFTTTNNLGCKTPLTVSFHNQSRNAVSYKWLFGDGSTSTDASPSHTYTREGSYDITLVTTGASGCSDSIVVKAGVVISPASVRVKNLPQEGCAPLLFSPVLEVDSPDSIANFRWDFGNGKTATGPAPSVEYASAGTYTVRLYFTTNSGCTDSVVYTDAVSAGIRPKVAFSATPRNTCAILPVVFTDLSEPAITSWHWSFGDGGTSTAVHPAHLYSDTGYFTVTLVVSSNGCADSLTSKDFVHIKTPVAAFTDSSVCSMPFYRRFKDASIGATSWQWNFGDNTTSTEQHPAHRYDKPGNYLVSLTVKNDTCESTISRQVSIISEHAGFTVSDTAICKGALATFQTVNLNTANTLRLLWTFGDGTSSGITDAVRHAYGKTGMYDVGLIVTDLNGCTDTLTKPRYVRVYGPSAAFSVKQAVACINDPVEFTDLSAGDSLHAIRQWTWNYGDGITETMTAPPFRHRYIASGTLNVQLKVTDSFGCSDSLTKPALVLVPNPVAGFLSPDSTSCYNKPIRFINLSSGTSLTSIWNFGDGTGASAVMQPTYSYPAEGKYTITLKVTDQYGCTDSMSRKEYVRILNPKPAFSVSDSVATCPPLIASFTNNSVNYIAYEWNFGDGTRSAVDNPTHFYNTAGTYNASLVVTSAGGCRDSAVRSIVVRGPQGDFSYNTVSGCSPVTITFRAATRDKVSFVWDFNDGTTISTADSVVTHVFTQRGAYVPKMILSDPQGCKVPIVGKDTVRVLGIDARFSADKAALCDSGLVSFTDLSQSNDGAAVYSWTFGDGAGSSLKNPSHFYRVPGNYPVQLVAATQSGCRDTARTTAAIRITQSPAISILGDTAACEPAQLRFTSNLVQPGALPVRWKWDFNNGQTDTLAAPLPVTYRTAGSYGVTAIAVNTGGCADTAVQPVAIHPKPPVDAGADALICYGSTYTLQGKAGNYLWSPALPLSCNGCATPVSRPDSTMRFTLLTKSPFGCTAEDSVLITVKQPFSVNVSPGDTLCEGGSLALSASGAERYTWTPASGLDRPLSDRPIARPSSTTVYRVVGSDAANCFYDTAYVPVVVYPYPVVDAGSDKTLQVGNTVKLDATLSADVSSIRWTPLAGLSCSGCAGPEATPKQTTTYTLEVSNQGGCTAKDNVTVYVICQGGNLFVPNTFSPNGDGINETFYPRGKGIYGVKSFRVFSRWGEQVFERTNFQVNESNYGWDGKIRGMNAAQDVYVYTIEVICENNTVLSHSGNVTLVR